METWGLLDGEVQVRDEGRAVWFRVDCRPPCELSRLLRCYCEGSNFLIGVLEPVDGRLKLERRVSRETLRQAGVEGLPSQFYLSDGGARTAQEETVEISTAEEVLEVTSGANGTAGESVQGSRTLQETTAKPVQASQTLQETAGKSAQAGQTLQKTAGKPAQAGQTLQETTAKPVQAGQTLQKIAGKSAQAGQTLLGTDETSDSRRTPLQEAAVDTAGNEAENQQTHPAIEEMKTGDALLDAALTRGDITCKVTENGLQISCPFSPVAPFPLAFIAPLCRVEHQTAIVEWKMPQAISDLCPEEGET
ncbi:hypothetical protein D7X33_19430 [Butyricicoccus sp. 1XD8-22]|nr:hypothetical protein D7X33_19430 [Butyricicoccus sp. 1XD8-22]